MKFVHPRLRFRGSRALKIYRAPRGNIFNKTHSKWCKNFQTENLAFLRFWELLSIILLRYAGNWPNSLINFRNEFPSNEQILFHSFRYVSSRGIVPHTSTFNTRTDILMKRSFEIINYNLTSFLWVLKACLSLHAQLTMPRCIINFKSHLIYFCTIKLSLRFLKLNRHKLFHERFHSRELIFHARVKHTRDCLPRLTQFDAHIHSYTRAIRENVKEYFQRSTRSNCCFSRGI